MKIINSLLYISFLTVALVISRFADATEMTNEASYGEFGDTIFVPYLNTLLPPLLDRAANLNTAVNPAPPMLSTASAPSFEEAGIMHYQLGRQGKSARAEELEDEALKKEWDELNQSQSTSSAGAAYNVANTSPAASSFASSMPTGQPTEDLSDEALRREWDEANKPVPTANAGAAYNIANKFARRVPTPVPKPMEPKGTRRFPRGSLLNIGMKKPVQGQAFFADIAEGNPNNPGQLCALPNIIKEGKFTVVEFYSPFSPECLVMKPKLESLAHARRDIAVRKLDIDRLNKREIDWNSPLARQYGIKRVPEFKLFDQYKKLLTQGQQARGEVDRAIASISRWH